MKLLRGRDKLPSLLAYSIERVDQKRKKRYGFEPMPSLDKQMKKNWLKRVFERLFSKQKHKINQ